MNNTESFTLNSLVRRTQHTKVLKEKIRSTGACLSRSGRSRNWRLAASAQQIQDILKLLRESSEESWLWLAKVLKENKRPLSEKALLDYAKQHPNTTVNELMAISDCTLIQARKILDELEWS